MYKSEWRSVLFWGIIVCLVLLWCVRSRIKRQQQYDREFGSVIKACRTALTSSATTKETTAATFVPKVVVCTPHLAPIKWMFMEDNFTARNSAEVGTVVFVSQTVRKAGNYVGQITRMRSHDALEVQYDVVAVDCNSKDVVGRCQIIGEPPEHSPPRDGEESAETKARRRLRSWISAHLQNQDTAP